MSIIKKCIIDPFYNCSNFNIQNKNILAFTLYDSNHEIYLDNNKKLILNNQYKY
jgi:hypothetical protein